MTGGGPGRSTYFFAMYVYDQAFQYGDMGYASVWLGAIRCHFGVDRLGPVAWATVCVLPRPDGKVRTTLVYVLLTLVTAVALFPIGYMLLIAGEKVSGFAEGGRRSSQRPRARS